MTNKQPPCTTVPATELAFDRVLERVPGGKYIAQTDWRSDDQHLVSFVALDDDSVLVAGVTSEFPTQEGLIRHYAVVPALVAQLLASDEESMSGSTTDIESLHYNAELLNNLRTLPVAQMLDLLSWAESEYNPYGLEVTCKIADGVAQIAKKTGVPVDIAREFASKHYLGPDEDGWEESLTAIITAGFGAPTQH